MDRNLKNQYWFFGVGFGAWIGGVYALTSGVINDIFLPNIPLLPPSGGLAWHLIQYILFGAFLGFITSLPDSTGAGLVLGGLSTAGMLVVQALIRTWGQESLGGVIMYMVCIFMPLIVLMMPIAYLIRAGVDAQRLYSDRPHLWARKYLIPFFLTLVAIALGALSLFPREQRLAIRQVNDFIVAGESAKNESELPEPLKDITGYWENAEGSYALTWSDRVDTFMGPRPAGAELSQFLVIVRFENDFAFACVFSSNRGVPNCVVY